jgi:hypothetical protein
MIRVNPFPSRFVDRATALIHAVKAATWSAARLEELDVHTQLFKEHRRA